MTAVLELGGVAAMAFTATTSLGLAGYGHANKCLNGYLRRRGTSSRSRKQPHERESERERRPHPLDGILSLEDVLCSTNGSEPCRTRVEFNGEVLFAELSDDGLMKPIMALCNMEVVIDGCKVTTSPLAPLPTMELVFDRESDAREWADALKEASKVCAPHVRIHELVAHIIDMEKHIKDLRGRAARVGDYEKIVNDLRKSIGMMKLEQEGVRTDMARHLLCNEPSMDIDSFREEFAKSSNMVSKERYEEAVRRYTQHAEELERCQEELQRLQAQNDDLREKFSQHVDPEEHQRILEEMRLHREESRQANDEIEVLRRRIDEAVPLLDEAAAQAATPHRMQEDCLSVNRMVELQNVVQDVEDKYADIRKQLATVERSYEEEQLRASSEATKVTTLTQEKEEERLRANSATSKVEALTQENQVLMMQIEELKNAGKSMLDAMTADKNAREEETCVAQSHLHISLEQLQRQIDEMHISFRHQMQAAQEEFTKKLEERQRQYEARMKELQNELRNKTSSRDDANTNGSNLERSQDEVLVIADSELTAKVGILAQENLNLKNQLSQKAQRLEIDTLALQTEAETIARPVSPLRQPLGQSNYALEVKTLLNSTPRSTLAANVTAQAFAKPVSTSSNPETSPLARVAARLSATPGLSVPSIAQSIVKKSGLSRSPKQSSPRTALSMDPRSPSYAFPAAGILPISRASVPSTLRPSPISRRTTSLS